jgi:hypothetical protein
MSIQLGLPDSDRDGWELSLRRHRRSATIGFRGHLSGEAVKELAAIVGKCYFAERIDTVTLRICSFRSTWNLDPAIEALAELGLRKPITAEIEAACGGAFLVALACRRIVALPTAVVGRFCAFDSIRGHDGITVAQRWDNDSLRTAERLRPSVDRAALVEVLPIAVLADRAMRWGIVDEVRDWQKPAVDDDPDVVEAPRADDLEQEHGQQPPTSDDNAAGTPPLTVVDDDDEADESSQEAVA